MDTGKNSGVGLYTSIDDITSFACSIGCKYCAFDCDPRRTESVKVDFITDAYQQAKALGIDEGAISLRGLRDKNTFDYIVAAGNTGIRSTLMLGLDGFVGFDDSMELYGGLAVHCGVKAVQFSFSEDDGPEAQKRLIETLKGIAIYNLKATRGKHTFEGKPAYVSAIVNFLDWYDNPERFDDLSFFSRIKEGISSLGLFIQPVRTQEANDLFFYSPIKNKKLPFVMALSKKPILPIGRGKNHPWEKFSGLQNKPSGIMWECFRYSTSVLPTPNGGHIIKPCGSLFFDEAKELGVFVEPEKPLNLKRIIEGFIADPIFDLLNQNKPEVILETARGMDVSVEEIISACQICVEYHKRDKHFKKEFVKRLTL